MLPRHKKLTMAYSSPQILMSVADTLVGSVLISVKILLGHIIVAVQWDSNFRLMRDLVKVRCYESPRERERNGVGGERENI